MDVVTGSTAGLAHRLRLDRAARNAGEAFAFIDTPADREGTRRTLSLGGIAGVFVALAAAIGLYLSF
jgi:hypothetical protein